MSKHTPKKYFDEAGNFIVKPYRMSDLLNIYDVDYQTMRKWLQKYQMEIGEKEGSYFSIDQVGIILKRIGSPKLLPNKLKQLMQ